MITLADIVAYALALGIAAFIPGPGITALVARSVGSGTRAGFAMLAGITLGDLLYLSFAVFGLALIAQSFNTLFVLIRWGSIAYLMYLAWQFWHAGHHELHTGDIRGKDLRAAMVSGLAITLGNPKTIAFYLALLPLVLDLNSITVFNWAAVLVPATVLVLLSVGSAYILGAMAVRRILAGATAQRHLHRSAALAMAGAAGSMIAREL